MANRTEIVSAHSSASRRARRVAHCSGLAAAIALAGFAAVASAASPTPSIYWNVNGGGTGWSDSANWTMDYAGATPAGAVPTPSDIVGIGTSSVNAGFTIALNANQSIAGLVINPGSIGQGAITLDGVTGGPYALTLGTTGLYVNSGTGAPSLSANVVLNGNQTWTNNAGSMTVNNSVTGTGNLILNGGYNWKGPANNFAGTLTINGVVDIFSDFNTNTAFTTTVGSGLMGAHGTISFAEPIAFTGGTGWYTNGGNATFANALTGGSLNIIGTGAYGVSGATNNTTSIITGQTNFSLGKTSSPTVHAVGASFEVGNGSTATITGTGGNQFASTTAVTVDYANPTTYGTLDFNGDSETFNTLSGGGLVTNNATGTTSTLTLGANNGSATFTGALQNGAAGLGVVALTKNGTGTATLTNANTYSGATTVNAGTLVLSASGIANSGAYVVNNGALSFTGTGNTFTGAITLGPSVTLSVDTSSINTPGSVTNSLSPNSDVTLNGSTLSIKGHTTGTNAAVFGDFDNDAVFVHNTDTSGLTVGQTITVPAGILVGGATTAVITGFFDGGTTFSMDTAIANQTYFVTVTPTAASYATSDTVHSLTLNAGASSVVAIADGHGSSNSTGPVVLNLGAVTRNAGSTVDFTLPGGAQSSTNGITLKNANTAGVILGGWATVGQKDWAVSGGTGTVAGNITPLGSYDGNTWNTGLNTDVSSSSISFNGAATNSLRFDAGGTNTVTLPGGVNTITSGGILVTNTNSSNVPTIAGGSLTSGNGSELIVNQFNLTNPLTISAPIVNSGATSIGLTKSGTGALALTGANTYSGATHINAGTLTVSNTGTLGNGAGSVILHGSGSLVFSNQGSQLDLASVGAVATGGPNTVQAAANAIDGDINTRWETGGSPTSDPGWIYVNLQGVHNLSSVAISWEFAGAQDFVLQAGTGITADPNGTNANGWTTVDTVTGQAPYGDKHFITYNLASGASGQYLAMYGTARNTGYGYSIWEIQVFQGASAMTQTIGSLNSSDATTSVNIASLVNLNTGGDNSSTTFAGVISGPGSLTKSGSGAFTLTNNNTYSGGTTLTNGTLIVANASGSATGTGAVTLNGGKLASSAGSGGFITGNVVAGSGSHILSPGGDGSIGALTVGGLSLNGFSTIDFDITSVAVLDSLTTGSLAASGIANIVVPTGLAANTYKIIGYSATGLTDASNFQLNGGVTPVGYSLALNAGELDLVVGAVGPINATWATNVDGNWSVSGNWTGGVPTGAGATANFTGNTLAAVNVDGPRTVGRILLSGATAYTIGGAAITLDNTGGAGGNAAITASGGATHTVNSAVITAADTDLNVSGTTTLNLAGGIANSGHTLTLNNTGAGTLNVGAVSGAGTTIVNAGTAANADKIVQNTLTVNGTLNIAANGGTAGMTQVNHLTIAGSTDAWTGDLNLRDNDLIVDYTGNGTPFATIKNQVLKGLTSGQTVGITSSTALAAGDTELAVIDNANHSLTTFGGITLTGNQQVLGKYTYKGDANLDGKVTGDDYGFVDSHLGNSGASIDWLSGDFNLDNKVTGDDYSFIDANLGKGTVSPLAYGDLQEAMIALHTAEFGAGYTAALDALQGGGGSGAAPEPASLGLLGLGAVGLLARRRRSK